MYTKVMNLFPIRITWEFRYERVFSFGANATVIGKCNVQNVQK